MDTKMKKRWIAGLCAITCAFALMIPAGNAEAKKEETTEVRGIVETFEAQKDTLTIPASTSTQRPETITRTGTITSANLKDTYTLNVKKSALTVKLSASSYLSYAVKTMGGTLLESGNCSATRQEVGTGISLNEGTYVLEVYALSANDPIDYTVGLYAVSAANTDSLSLGKASLAFGGKNDVHYKKIVVKAPGLLSVKAYMITKSEVENYYDGTNSYLYSANIALCNSNKKEIVKGKYAFSSKGYTNSYGVKKGTYYIKITQLNDQYYYVKPSLKKYSNGTTDKKKAIKVTSKYKNYVVPAGNSSAMWFKIKVTKPKKLNAYIKYSGSDSISVEIYKGSKKESSSTLYSGKALKFRWQTLWGSAVKWPKGTYYIKVKNNKLSDKSGGIVSVKVK